jgi:molecular chaperone HtpG
LQCPEVPDDVSVNKVYLLAELSNAEFSFLIKVASTLQEDYLLQDIEVNFADISHGVPFLVQSNNSKLSLFISKTFQGISPVLKFYDTAYDIFPGFVKDFVRAHIYEIVRIYIPSATKDGIDVLQNKLRKKRELYRLEQDDFEKIDNILSDYLAGKATFSEVISASSNSAKGNIETVAKESVSKVESEIPDLVESPVSATDNQNIGNGILDYPALPPIDREQSTTQSKVLTVDTKVFQLNNFCLFLSVSQRLFDRDRDFFLDPHKTKIIWGSHRIVYIFLSSRTNFTLYYDIELKEPLKDSPVGGKCIPSTTIITKDKIFIPVIDEAVSAFKVIDTPKEFIVRYDYIY